MRKFGFPLTKRRKVIFASFILTSVLWIFQLREVSLIFIFLLVGTIAYLLTYWVLDFDLRGEEYFVLPILSIALASALVLMIPILQDLGFSFLLPITSFLSFYTLFLTLNILNISTVRPLPLVRAAWTALHVVHFGLSLMLFGAIFWFGLSLISVVLLSFLIAFLLSYPSYYFLIHALDRGDHPSFYMFFTGFIVAELAFVFSFLDLSFYLKALNLAGAFYIITGFFEHDLRADLSQRSIYEYLLIILLFFLISFVFNF